ALNVALTGKPGTPPENEPPPEGGEEGGEGGEGEGGAPTTEVDQLLQQAEDAYNEALAALRQDPPDLGTYQEKVEEMQDLIERARQQLAAQSAESPPGEGQATEEQPAEDQPEGGG